MRREIPFALTLGLMLTVAFVSCNTKSPSEQGAHQAVSVKALGAGCFQYGWALLAWPYKKEESPKLQNCTSRRLNKGMP